MFHRWSIFALSFALASVAVVVVRSQQYGDTNNNNNNNNNDNNNPPSNQYVFPTSGDGYTKGKKYQVDTTNDNPPGVPANADNLQLFDAWTTGDALTSQQLALIAEKLGGIVVYIFSYLFMASVFVSYILGVVILMIFKIMFGAFLPVASVELQSLPVYNVTQAPSSGSGGGGSAGGSSGGNSYGTGSGGGSASYGSGSSGGGGGGSRYKRSMEMDLAFGREARALMPYTIDGNQMDYMDQNAGLFDRTKAFLNRGYATGRFMFDVLKQPECQKYIMCSTSSTFREERSGGVRYRDMLRQITPVVGRLARSVDDLTQSVNLGSMVGRCHHPTMNCPALQPAVHKMNELLQYLGVKAQ